MTTIDLKQSEQRLKKQSVRISKSKIQKVEDLKDGIYFNSSFNDCKTEKYETLIFREKSKTRK